MSDIEYLQNHPLVKEFAACYDDHELYAIICKTNPTLKMTIDIARKIVESDVSNNEKMNNATSSNCAEVLS